MASNPKFCLIYTLSTPWENYHREQFIKTIASEIKKHDGYILGLEPTIFSVFNLFVYPERFIKWIKRKYKFRKVLDNLFVVPAFTFEHILLSTRFKPLSVINSILVRRQIKKCLKKIDKEIKSTILVLHRPELNFLIGNTGEKGAVYDCCDDHCVTSSMNKIKVLGNRKREKLLSQKCDFVITTSNVLFERNKQANVNTYLVENGFIEKNFSFNDVVKNELMEKLKKPVIGYVGNIRNWMDFDMLEYLIKSNPNYTFIFIGEVNKNAAAQFTNITTKYSNICITGRIPYYDLFRYFFYIDIGIIPFKVNEFMLSVNPNKFYEFMGAGIPVVATNMGDLKAKYSDIAKIAQDKYQFNEFVRTLAELPKHEILNLKVKILELSKFHTWESKAELFYNLLNKLILSKN